jgi:hypothetical protein
MTLRHTTTATLTFLSYPRPSPITAETKKGMLSQEWIPRTPMEEIPGVEPKEIPGVDPKEIQGVD